MSSESLLSLEEFNNFLLKNGQQPSTTRTYLKIIKRVLIDVQPLTKENFDDYIGNYVARGNRRSYIKQIIIGVKFWATHKNIPELFDYPFPKYRQWTNYKGATMADKEIDAFLALKNPHKKNSFMYRRYEMWTIFFLIMCYHGNRPGEAAKLHKIPTKEEPSTIDFGRNILIFSSKRKTREVPISFVIRDRLRVYIESLDGDYLFPPMRKTGYNYIKEIAWQLHFKDRLSRMEAEFPGISKRLNLRPYSLRKSAATRWNDDDWSLPKIQEALGHSQLNTTRKYIDVGLEKVAEMINGDRLALPYKKGKDILTHCIDLLKGVEQRNSSKMMISSLKITKGGKRYYIVIDAIDG
jgi:integrase